MLQNNNEKTYIADTSREQSNVGFAAKDIFFYRITVIAIQMQHTETQ